MKKLAVLAIFVVFAVLATQSVWAQTQTKEPRWGLQVDLGTSFVPTSLVNKMLSSDRLDKVAGQSGSIGLVRFNAKGGPSFGLYYSEVRMTGEGTDRYPYLLPYRWQPPGVDPSDPLATIEKSISGHARARGLMVSKFANFVTRKHVGFGMRFGIGVGSYQVDYTRRTAVLTQSGKEFPLYSKHQSETYQHVWPMFEILGQLEVRPISHLSLGPIFGIRNAALVAGGSLTLRF